MSREIRQETIQLELYIINNEQYTDYDIGDIVYKSTVDDEVLADAYEVCRYVAKKIYQTFTGEYKCIIEIELAYICSYDYFDGWYEDMHWNYELISKEETDYWDEGET